MVRFVAYFSSINVSPADVSVVESLSSLVAALSSSSNEFSFPFFFPFFFFFFLDFGGVVSEGLSDDFSFSSSVF